MCTDDSAVLDPGLFPSLIFCNGHLIEVLKSQYCQRSCQWLVGGLVQLPPQIVNVGERSGEVVMLARFFDTAQCTFADSRSIV